MNFTKLRTVFCITIGLSVLAAGVVSPASPPRIQEVPGAISNPRDLIKLGRALFYDKSLSNPPGMACVSCHDPAAGYSYPSSMVNLLFGTVPGQVPGRAGSRRPPMVAYAPYLPAGPPHYNDKAQAWVGGLFWDGRVNTALEQVRSPLVNPNEMNSRVHNVGDTRIVVEKIAGGINADLFRKAFGADVFSKSTAEVFDCFGKAIVAFEASPEVSPFTSKYDAYLLGKAKLTDSEMLGLRLFTGSFNGRPGGRPFKKSAHCVDCHATSLNLNQGPDIWTNGCYANLGVPSNPANLYYDTVDRKGNPVGYNRNGRNYVDLGLGNVLYDFLGIPEWRELDPLQVNGAFKAPSVRNVDLRPYPGFVKAYMHNGVFKSLKAVVHFYNTRNVTTEHEVIDFTAPDPYAGLKGKPIWDPPEYLDQRTLVNATGSYSGIGRRPKPGAPRTDQDAMQIGNLHMSEGMENAIVDFLKTLSDGYFVRAP